MATNVIDFAAVTARSQDYCDTLAEDLKRRDAAILCGKPVDAIPGAEFACVADKGHAPPCVGARVVPLAQKLAPPPGSDLLAAMNRVTGFFADAASHKDDGDLSALRAWAVCFRALAEKIDADRTRLERDLKASSAMVDAAVAKERKRCHEIAYQYADVEGDSEHLRPNTAMVIADEIEGGK